MLKLLLPPALCVKREKAKTVMLDGKCCLKRMNKRVPTGEGFKTSTHALMLFGFKILFRPKKLELEYIHCLLKSTVHFVRVPYFV